MIDPMARVVLGVSVALALAGCDVAFRIDHVSEHDGGGADTTASPACDAAFIDDFDDGVPCASWATPNLFGDAMLTETDGAMIVTPGVAAGNAAGCFSKSSFALGTEGVIVEVSAVIGGNNGEYTLFGFPPPVDLAISAGTGELRFQDNAGGADHGRRTYLPADMRWWRMRPVGNDVIAEYSANGQMWTQLGNPVPVAAKTIEIGLIAGLATDQTSGTGRAVFEQLLVCH
jgi:hypothetical protein